MSTPSRFPSSPLFPLPRAVRRMMDRRRHRKSVQQIMHLDDRMLDDLGLKRSQVLAAFERHADVN
jgi:uncharacterized protein YjiS (DUF1127 family)